MAKKKYTTVSLSEFFENNELNFDNEVEKKRHPFIQFLITTFGIVFLSLIAGGLMSIPFLVSTTAAIPVVDAGIKTWNDLPSEIEDVQISEINKLYDVNGKVFAEVWSENRIELDNLDEINDIAINALIATEDKRFYEHKGIDTVGTIRAAISGSGGGSGITQQTIKNLRFYNKAGIESQEKATEATIGRKIGELKLAINYEKTHSKDEILLTYFNTVAMGSPNRYGIEAASNYFFDKKAKDLTLPEASALIGTVQNPVKYDMRKEENFDQWKSRQNIVLNRMVNEGIITEKEKEEAYDTKLDLKMKEEYSGNCASSSEPNYCNYTMKSLVNNPRLGDTQEERESVVSKGGLNIYTYYDPAQTKIVKDKVQSDYGNTNRVVAPIAVVEPGTGGVKAMAVNRNYGEGEGETTLNFPDLPTGTGSTYKMITLAAALESGLTEDDLTFSSQCPLYPGPNYDYPAGGFKNSMSCAYQGGTLNYQRATSISSNTWFVTLEKRIGVDKVKEFSKSVGLSAPDSITSRSLSYTLGVTENSPIDMAAAFATFSNNGIFCPATPISNFEYDDGSKPRMPDNYDPSKNGCKRVMSSQDASIVLKAMRANTSSDPYPDAFGHYNHIKGNLAVGKSGTNQLYNSAWGQVSSNAAIFINTYDPVNINRLIETINYKGGVATWIDNASSHTGGEIMRALVKYDKPKPLNFNSKDNSMEDTPVDLSEFYVVPSVLGMKPENAVNLLESTGLEVKILSQKQEPTSMFPSGVIIDQSLSAGTRLAFGTDKEMVLTISK